ncbi:hypothetical protein BDZ89DRAFT_1073366 [Hymenopellis radicata]|nr:hypothetical protein BDZ89DRAFT_1073366 [Hymenopellis radicata]
MKGKDTHLRGRRLSLLDRLFLGFNLRLDSSGIFTILCARGGLVCCELELDGRFDCGGFGCRQIKSIY